MQYYQTSQETNYDYIESANNYYQPAPPGIYHNNPYAHSSYGSNQHGQPHFAKAHYGHFFTNEGHRPPSHHGYNSTHYGHYKEHDNIVQTHAVSSFGHGANYANHIAPPVYGHHHGSGKVHASFYEKRERRMRKRRENGWSDYSDESGSDSDHEFF